MTDINNIKFEPHLTLDLGKKQPQKVGGIGGSITIETQNLSGNGSLIADGGDGQIPGNGGKVDIRAKIINFSGKVSVKGGRKVK